MQRKAIAAATGPRHTGAAARRAALCRHGRAHGGFTLIEIMVALGLFMLLLLIVFVPLNQALAVFNSGRAEIGLQQAAQQTMSRIQAELQKAVYVYPNDSLPEVTRALPYGNSPPYYVGATCTRIGNPGRLDFLVGRSTAGTLEIPLRPERYVISYYPRRLHDTLNYDKIDNPVVLFRAQMPYKFGDDTTTGGTGARANLSNISLDATRYTAGVCVTQPTGAAWLRQDADTTEALIGDSAQNLTGNAVKTGATPLTVYGSNTMITPRGEGLPVDNPNADAGASNLSPELSFTCEDSNNDGKIDRVTVNLALEHFEQSNEGGDPRGHTYRVSQVIDLPNIR